MKNQTLKEFLLSKGINIKQETYERTIKIDNIFFRIMIDEKLRSNISILNPKEMFLLSYKIFKFLKKNCSFSILYIPKEVILKGECNKLSNNEFKINLLEELKYTDEELLVNEKNIIITDKLDNSINIEIL